MSYLSKLMKEVDGWFTVEEGALLHRLASQCTGRGVIVEIGSWQGKSTICLARGAREGKVRKIVAIDPHTGSTEHQGAAPVWTFENFKRNIQTWLGDDQALVHPITKMSWDAVGDVNEPIEFIFIDGAHDYDSVKRDFNDWYDKVVDGGFMAFHDSAWPGVRAVLRDDVYLSRRFVDIDVVLGTTYARKSTTVSPAQALLNSLKWLKFIAGVRMYELRKALRHKILSLFSTPKKS